MKNIYLCNSRKKKVLGKSEQLNLGLGVFKRFFHSIHFIQVIIVLLVKILLQTCYRLILQTLEGVIKISNEVTITSLFFKI